MMINLAKGDGIFQAIELILRLLRAVTEMLIDPLPTGPIDQWGWPQWLWALFLLTATLWLVWVILSLRKKP
ncbi:MAG: hypothetical protein EPN21_10270 [Methylococcaceae bacterium]|nr:MAG: hypothetical protein EPN21_10270 [Methylococcaceae bacterium]